ncbi:BZ3500_MvSof-1268-A1-R1_Chr2-1g04644 [Microbotryum saponariae]|uniref:holo-[acyl-carrier-protein] synthase n=1 Tax=Microbotryum saponariae TaxID=289078 RepID=A0A2X0MKE4_9BASI|nr:BZ3500_MvSof-1268-A1-R1_Chr2-1g04644 [Microbotryum saponariae]SCZ92195.1 BZ3501_MvSof-1269-A2-R1_Chr2-1g04300 [Microbotryum saponariae]
MTLPPITSPRKPSTLQIHAVHVPTTLPDHEAYRSHLHLLRHDPEAVQEIQRYRLIDDSKRALVSRLLPRYVLALQGLDWRQVRFEKGEYARPLAVSRFIASEPSTKCSPSSSRLTYISQIHPNLPKGFQYSASHDAEWVICASTFGTDHGQDLPRVQNIGVDVMRLMIPWENVDQKGMLDIMKDHLSFTELAHIQSDPNPDLEKLFSYWVLKEAYIKARSLGLRGFPELKRIEFHLDAKAPDGCWGWKTVKGSLDRVQLDGWCFGLKTFDGGRYLLGMALELDGGGEVEEPSWEVVVLDRATILDTLQCG